MLGVQTTEVDATIESDNVDNEALISDRTSKDGIFFFRQFLWHVKLYLNFFVYLKKILNMAIVRKFEVMLEK